MSSLSNRDQRAFFAAAITAAVMIAQQVGAKATRDTLFLDRYEAAQLPIAMLAGAATSLVAVLVFSQLVTKLGPERVVPPAFALSGLLFGAEWMLAESQPAIVVWMLYLHIATFGAVVISGFWSIFNERFDPRTARRLIGRVGAGATLGGLLGGFGAERLSANTDLRTNFILLGALSIACAYGARRLGRTSPKLQDPEKVQGSGLEVLRNSPYLLQLAGLVALTGFSAAILDFALKAQADARLEGKQELLQFFTAFYAAASLLTFIAQSGMTKRALSKLGIAGTISLLPAGVLIGSVLGAAVTRLWSVTLVRGLGTILENSMFRSGYELLYTPIAASKKRSTKTIIDVGFDRLGDALGGLAVLGVVAIAPALAEKAMLALATVLSALALALAWRLHAGYIQALAESLRDGAVALEENDVLDATTKKTLAETTMALDRDRLLLEIQKLRKSHDSVVPASSDSVPPSAPAPQSRASAPDALSELTNALLSDDEHLIAEQLSHHGQLLPEVAPLIIRLLPHPRLNRPAQDALAYLDAAIIGTLHDHLVSARVPRTIRRRLPAVLRRISHKRSAHALGDGLKDQRFDIRYRCGLALVALKKERPEAVRLSKKRLHQLVLDELDETMPLRESEPPEQGQVSNSDESVAWLDEILRNRMNRKLEHAFSILCLLYDMESLRLSLRALWSEDRNLRGTALEYLENVLPQDVRNALFPHLGASSRKKPSGERKSNDILEELLRSSDGLVLDPGALKKPIKGA